MLRFRWHSHSRRRVPCLSSLITATERTCTGVCGLAVRFIFIPVTRTSFLSRHFTISLLKGTIPTNACASYNSTERVLCLVSTCYAPFFFQWINNKQSMYMKNFLPLYFDWYLQKRGVLAWTASLRERCIAYRHHKSIFRDYFELSKCLFPSLQSRVSSRVTLVACFKWCAFSQYKSNCCPWLLPDNKAQNTFVAVKVYGRDISWIWVVVRKRGVSGGGVWAPCTCM